MKLLEGLKIALNAIWAHKMRSFLTMLGIIIGIGSVIIVVNLGQGNTASIQANFESYGVNRATIALNFRAQGTSKDRLTVDDVELLEKNFSDYMTGISPRVSQSVETTVNGETESIAITGVSASYNSIDEKELVVGRYLLESDIENRRDVIVIDEELAEVLFGNTNVVGERLMLATASKKVAATIVGVYEYEETLGMSGYTAYMPYTSVQKMTSNSKYIDAVEINLEPDIDIDTTLDQMVSLLEKKHDNVGDEKYRATSAGSMLDMVSDVMGQITLLVGGIAAISLLVGGIGVMNIMLVSVTERTREIGIRKAIGAQYRDILIQFLSEAVILTLLGGILGTVLGIGLSRVVAGMMGIPKVISLRAIIIAWVFSAFVGVFFGIYPANRAAKLNPIDALRYE